MPTILFSYLPTGGDDFLLGLGGADTIAGGDGDDYILGDTGSTIATGTSNSLTAPGFIDGDIAWTTDENPFFGDSSIPHTSLYIRADAGQTHYSLVTVGAGETITVDIDFGNLQSIGLDTDVMLQLYDSSGVVVASNDDSLISAGGDGSTSITDCPASAPMRQIEGIR
jgi:Ca2+-binding RTX toxin-like protein